MVAFGDALNDAVRKMPPEMTAHCVEYQTLKEEVYCTSREKKLGAPQSNLTNPFLQLLNHSIDQLNRYYSAELQRTQTRLLSLHRTAAAADGKTAIDSLKEEARSIGDHLVLLESFTKINSIALVKICKKYDKNHHSNTMSWLTMRMPEEPINALKLDPYLLRLSDVWQAVREAEAGASAEGGVWTAPTSFERSTTKYWVKTNEVLLVVTKILEHVPCLIYGRKNPGKARSKAQMLMDTIDQNTGFWSWISSLYLDNQSLDCYHTRLRRDEGAQLLRLRWYGLACGKEVFVERKTHHENWSGEKSTKERLGLSTDQVPDFLGGNLKMDKQLDALAISGKETPEVVDKLKTLSAEVQNSINKLELKPCVRSVYQRSAFQSSSSNDVRVTIDTDLMLIEEDLGKNAAPGSGWEQMWRVASSVEVSESVRVIDFPYAVVELKLQGEAPPWVVGLLDLGVLLPAAKFSKYLTGAAAIHAEHAKVVPEWFDEPTIKACLEQRQEKNESFAKWRIRKSINTPGPNIVLAQACEVESHKKPVSPTTSSTAQTSVRSDPTTASSVVSKMPVELTKSSALKPPVKRGYVSVRRWRSRATSVAPSHAVVNASARRGRSKSKSMRQSVKVEPKTFFANERTFIQWISVGVLILTLGIAFFDVQNQAKGIIFIALALVTVLYGLGIFVYRLEMIKRKRSSGFDSKWPPIILVACICAIIITYAVETFGGSDDAYYIRYDGRQRTKNFKVALEPGAFLNRSRGIENILQSISSHHAVSDVRFGSTKLTSPSVTIHHDVQYDTLGTNFLAKARSSLQLQRQLEATAAADGSFSFAAKRGFDMVTLKKENTDEAMLEVAPLECGRLYSATCSIKLEQDVYASGNTKFAMNLTVQELPGTFELSTASDLLDLVNGNTDTLNKAFFSAPEVEGASFTSDTRLIARDSEYRWRYTFTFMLKDILQSGMIDLHFSTKTALQSQTVPTAGELSFYMEADRTTSYFNKERVSGAQSLLRDIQDTANWIA
uniref:SPX domain-containing protein n=1 Tax=Chrysotila carterae TaxID=13221 RepID=A0A7S4F3S0_CHRCT